MSYYRKSITIFWVALSFGAGILLDRCFKDFPYLQLDPKIGVLDIATLLVTIAIAVMIPIFVTKIIEDKKGIKVLLVDEIKELITIVLGIKKVISDAHKAGEFKATNRDQINFMFHDAQMKVASIKEQLAVAFKHDSEEIGEKLFSLLSDYDDYLTGGELMLSTFTKVEDNFYMENCTKYSKIETGLKTLIQKIYKL